MKAQILPLLVFLTLISPVLAEQVCSVHDGDTIRLCEGQRVRFHGIDAPELRQPGGQESRNYLSSLVMGQDVQLECESRRSYNRLVCRVSVGKRDIEELMVSHGWAFDYAKYSGGQYSQDEAYAQRHGLGVWSMAGGGVRPWDWRHNRRQALNQQL